MAIPKYLMEAKICNINTCKEIDRLAKTITDYEELLMQKNNIIDQAKEYIEKNYFKVGRIKELYEMLDKEIK